MPVSLWQDGAGRAPPNDRAFVKRREQEIAESTAINLGPRFLFIVDCRCRASHAVLVDNAGCLSFRTGNGAEVSGESASIKCELPAFLVKVQTAALQTRMSLDVTLEDMHSHVIHLQKPGKRKPCRAATHNCDSLASQQLRRG